MKRKQAHNHPEVLTEITVGIGETDRRAVTLNQLTFDRRRALGIA